MIKAKEKAEEIYNDFDIIIYTDQDHYHQVKQCALLCVDKIIQTNPADGYYTDAEYISDSKVEYWNEVKKEIQKLKG